MRDIFPIRSDRISLPSLIIKGWRRARGFLVSIRLWAECISLGRPLIVIHLQETGLAEHVEPVIAWLLKSERCNLLVVVENSQIKAYCSRTTIPYGDKRSLRLMSEGEFSTLTCKPKVILSLHPETPSKVARRFSSDSCCRVVMQHGLSDKGAFHVLGDSIEDPLADCDVIFLAGPVFRQGSLQRYAEINPNTFRRLRFMEIGSPKTDALFHPSHPRNELLTEMGLNPKRPLVCYAPTFERTASLEQHGIEIMRALAGLDVNVIVKLHHCSLKLPDGAPWIVCETDGKDWNNIVQSLEQEYPNLKLATKQNANPYLSATDVLVSDASGVAYEFLLLNRPIIFFDVPDLFDKYEREGIHYWGRKCGDVVSSTEELILVLKNALSNPNHKLKERQEMIRELVYSKGKATETAGRALLALAEKGC